jgi:YidC/Oxa1 family membrane protein insertase
LIPILLTKDQGAILGPISNILGMLMNGIFEFLDFINIPNTGLAIFLFTVVIYICMLPLTIRQQKFSKLSAKMNPEIQAIRDRYKNKKDQQSLQDMNVETQQVYAKYGVSPSGSCVQLIIQMPILFALYRVIGNMPAYVGKIKESFSPLVENLIVKAGSAEFIQGFKSANTFARNFENELFVAGTTTDYVKNTFIDVINKASSTELLSIADKYPDLSENVNRTIDLLGNYNNFLGINIGNSPSFMVSEAWNNPSGIAWLALIAAFAIPVLSAVTQWINVKLMPQQMPTADANGQPSTMAQSMKMMNMTMPLFSAFFCFTLPAGMGLYWIAGSVVRSVQQVVINRHMDKIDLDDLIKKNIEKRNKKLAKSGITPNKLNTYANLNTKKVVGTSSDVSATSVDKGTSQSSGNQNDNLSSSNNNMKKGGIAAKANMVKQFNEKNN